MYFKDIQVNIHLYKPSENIGTVIWISIPNLPQKNNHSFFK